MYRICLQEALHGERDAGPLYTTLCRGVARQVIASIPLQARVAGRAVLPGLPVPTDVLLWGAQHAAMQVCM